MVGIECIVKLIILKYILVVSLIYVIYKHENTDKVPRKMRDPAFFKKTKAHQLIWRLVLHFIPHNLKTLERQQVEKPLQFKNGLRLDTVIRVLINSIKFPHRFSCLFVGIRLYHCQKDMNFR
jgi:hypothetical protein